jgi:osmotically-inducible protein OsmY
MRRFFVGVALFTLAAVTPLAAWGGDREIAEQIFAKLQTQKSAGVLQGFDLGMDVKEGRVLLKGHVSTASQKAAVLAAANEVDGVTEIVDQIRVGEAAQAAPSMPVPVKIDAQTGAVANAEANKGAFSLGQALIAAAPRGATTAPEAVKYDSMVRPAGTTEPVGSSDADASLKASVMGALSGAQSRGELRGFGLSVSSNDGDVLLRGRARTAAVKAQIIQMVRRMPGVKNVIDDIEVVSSGVSTVSAPMPFQGAPEPRNLQPVEVQTVANRMPVQDMGPIEMAAPMAMEGGYGQAPSMAGGYSQGGYQTGGYAGTPVPMSPIPQSYGAPMYDSPNLPNYAWPGYASYPNYAALTYPQQYSPSAWPYIGPFYPYPQVPLGWRKVSLEWDDGWWFLDFTDK